VPVSREGAIVLNNLLLTTCCATVFVGTLYPLALEAMSGEKISVGPPFFNLTFVPLFIPLFILMPVGQLLPWKRGDLAGVAQRLAVAFGAGLIFMAVLAAWRGGPAISVILSGVAVYVILGSFVDLGRRLFGGGVSADMVSQRARGLPRHAFGTAFAHAGLGVTLLGLAATGWGAEKITALKPGEMVEIGPYELTFESVVPRNGPNYSELAGHTLIRSIGALVATIEPATRFYPTRRMTRSEAGIATLGLGQVYMSIADVAANGTVNARIFWKPLVALIWIGALVMAFGGCLSLSDRSFRVGIARRVRKAQAPRPQPAE
jgi:cytochrome c-type biogenesis protein CcmF